VENLLRLTGEKRMNYWDVVYLKEKLRGVLLARDPNNIQMLKCFSLENIINGLVHLVKDCFNRDCEVSTIILDKDSLKLEEEVLGKPASEDSPAQVNLTFLNDTNDKIILFKIKIKGRGTILMDMFNRSSKFNQHQVSTLTEVGASQLENQEPVAYVVDGMDKNATYLSFD
jgi:Zn-dependent oligopeptidase